MDMLSNMSLYTIRNILQNVNSKDISVIVIDKSVISVEKNR